MADKFLRCEVIGSIANSITVKPYVDGAGIITVCQQDNILFDPDTLRAEGAEEMRQAALDALARTAREKFNLSDEYNHYLAGLMDGELAIKELPPARIQEKPKKRKHICWQFCRDLNDINEAIYGGDPDWEGLYSADQIINILYHPSHGSYVVFWKREMTT